MGDGTVTGAGVVLAQRVEQLAEPGGLCITAALHEALGNHRRDAGWMYRGQADPEWPLVPRAGRAPFDKGFDESFPFDFDLSRARKVSISTIGVPGGTTVFRNPNVDAPNSFWADVIQRIIQLQFGLGSHLHFRFIERPASCFIRVDVIFVVEFTILRAPRTMHRIISAD